jgi:hypothetical protein
MPSPNVWCEYRCRGQRRQDCTPSSVGDMVPSDGGTADRTRCQEKAILSISICFVLVRNLFSPLFTGFIAPPYRQECTSRGSEEECESEQGSEEEFQECDSMQREEMIDGAKG